MIMNIKKLAITGLVGSSFLLSMSSANGEELQASGTISASCAFLSNNSGTLIASNNLKELGTIYGNQPTSITYTIAVSGGASLDYSEPSTLAQDGVDITGEVTIAENVSYRNSNADEVELGQPEGIVNLVSTSVYDFSHDVGVTKNDDTEFAPGTYQFSKTVTCTGGVSELPVEPIETTE